jgi:hypothetical protein
VASYRRQGVGFRGLTAKGAAARMGLDTPSWPNSEGMRPVFIDCGAPAGTRKRELIRSLVDKRRPRRYIQLPVCISARWQSCAGAV